MHLLLHKQKVSDCASLAKVQYTSSTHVFCARDEDHAILELPASCHKVYCIVVRQHCLHAAYSVVLYRLHSLYSVSNHSGKFTTMNSAMALTYTHILLLLFYVHLRYLLFV